MAREPEPIRITSAQRSHAEDIAGRQRRYLISMAVRTVAFLGACVLGVRYGFDSWYVWLLFVASLLLPSIAVVVANAGAAPDPGGPDLVDPDPTLRALGAAPTRGDERP